MPPKNDESDVDDKKTDDKKADDKKDEKKVDGTKPDEATQKLALAEAENARLKKRDADRKKKDDDAEAIAAAKKAKDEGKLEEHLTVAQKRSKDLEDENAILKKSIEDRTLKAIEKLSPEQKATLMKYKERVSFDAWQDLVEDALAAGTTSGDGKKITPPPTGGVVNDPKDGDAYELSDKAKEVLDEQMVDTRFAKSLKMVRDEATGAMKLTRPVKQMFADMTRKDIHKLSLKNARNRSIEAEDK